jgi:transcriptional regulator with XRE-family HTH domain
MSGVTISLLYIAEDTAAMSAVGQGSQLARLKVFDVCFAREALAQWGRERSRHMRFKDIVDRIAELPHPIMGESRVPPPELIAFFMRWVRGSRQLKKQALASLAGVSLSTVERIERGETVSVDLIDSVGEALGYDAGYLTAPRTPIDPGTAIEGFVETYEHLQPVTVASIRTQAQIRTLAHCHAYLPFAPEDDDEQRHALNGLIEYIDFVSFMLGKGLADMSAKDPRRELYADVLRYIDGMKRNGWTVLAGVMDAPRRNIPEWRLAVFSITSRAKNPGTPKRKTLLVDKRIAQQPPGPFPWELRSPTSRRTQRSR